MNSRGLILAACVAATAAMPASAAQDADDLKAGEALGRAAALKEAETCFQRYQIALLVAGMPEAANRNEKVQAAIASLQQRAPDSVAVGLERLAPTDPKVSALFTDCIQSARSRTN